MFITFEGIDGSGKSSLSKLLAHKFGYVWTSTPGAGYAPIRQAATGNIFSSFHYYVSSCYAVSRQAENQDIVCDRYIHSTLAYNWPFDSKAPEDAFAPFPKLQRPQLSFLLTADRDVRFARMKKRREQGGEMTALDLDFEAQDKALEVLLGFRDMIVIDTSELNQDEVLKKILRACSNFRY